MPGLSWVMILMMTMMKRDTASADIIKVSKVSGEEAVLRSGFQEQMLRTRQDFRWTHSNLLLTNKSTRCHHGRCQLLQDGSLSFSAVQAADSGSYTLEVYDHHGTIKEKKEFLLQVTVSNQNQRVDPTSVSPESPTVMISIISLVILLFLLLLFITVFILRKRRLGRSRTSDPMQETSLYIEMRGNHGNHGTKDSQEEQKKDEEPIYVPCNPGIPAQPPENIYV
ncbi:uncharacterized protein LOC105918487 isoform X2 [Fundulus heteroclitus]|uniref:uncharacterized protein LOC105918487 isoform X2 n=1 Tax=Fundulus heteroclitus TaxID=8078 RepID=UPI00165BB2BA|nr:uncharacterized protein LOC105918487 isoform X2 [Fundulus heteroclitus]